MKKSISVILIIVLCFSLFSVTNVSAAEIEPQIDRDIIQGVLEHYFTDFYNVLLDDTRNFTHEDFDSTNGYIIGKELMSMRYEANVLYGGMANAKFEGVSIEDILAIEDGIEVMAYVEFSYSYGMDPDDIFEEGNLFRILMALEEDSYRVLDLDSNSDYSTMAKETLAVWNTSDIEKNYAAVDTYYEEQDRNADSMLEWNTDDFAEPVEEEEEISPRAGISFNARKAKFWGYKLGKEEENYIFKRASQDCTNFVSQCIWAGYGGADGYTIPRGPDPTNPTCIALKKRVKEYYRMIKGIWFGRNFDSSAGDPPAAWCGVLEFYDYVTTNTGNGPRATGYNDNKPYSSLSTNIKMGDVLQFYNNTANRYRHSVIVVTEKTFTTADADKIKVAQHTPNDSALKLKVKLRQYGGSSAKIRLLRFKSATF